MNTTNKRRSVNFSRCETKILIKLLKKYRNVIESKKTDQVSLKTKSNGWDKLCWEFNSQTTTQRTPQNLKKKWDNMKKNLKQKMLHQKSISQGTEGLSELNLSSDEEEMLSIINLRLADGSPAEFDYDNCSGDENDEPSEMKLYSFDSALYEQPDEPSIIIPDSKPPNVAESISMAQKREYSGSLTNTKKYKLLEGGKRLVQLRTERLEQEIKAGAAEIIAKHELHQLAVQKFKNDIEESNLRIEILKIELEKTRNK